MAKYVLSDIHGNQEAFDKILQKINFGPTDILYVLGDVIDRHPHGVELLKRIKAMPNARMLLGNHEYMMLCVFLNKETHPEFAEETCDLWVNYNGGYSTLKAFLEEPEEVQNELLDWLKNLPLEYWEVTPRGVNVQMVHACPANLYEQYNNGHYRSVREFTVWDREAITPEVLEKDLNHVVIFGHTTTDHFQTSKDGNTHILQKGSGIGIDCGSGWPNGIGGRLCCLRLDDGKVFYSDRRLAKPRYHY